jgi:hypothetical protein
MTSPSSITTYAPSTYSAATSNTLPNIPGYTSTDYNNGLRDMSAATYHTLANVKAGRGDPCKLVGLTVAQIQAGTYDSGLYRLPTQAENVAFYSLPNTIINYVAGNDDWAITSTPTAGIRIGSDNTTFLPASGSRRSTDGATHYIGGNGFYWTSQPGGTDNASYLLFGKGYVLSQSGNANARGGLPVRCVKQ